MGLLGTGTGTQKKKKRGGCGREEAGLSLRVGGAAGRGLGAELTIRKGDRPTPREAP